MPFRMYTLLILAFLIVSPSMCSDKVNCDKVKYTFAEKGLNTEDSKDSNDELVLVCGNGPCCTEFMQRQLSEHSKRQFSTALNQTLASIYSILNNRAVKFDEFFKEMLSQSKLGFHDMFKKTYGIIYEQNSYVFTDMFEELEKYYSKGRIDLIESMDSFFNTLYQKMFTVMNAQYHFSDSYLVCVSDHMKDLKPFGDVPNKFTVQLKRSFVATRTFAQALYIAASIVSNMQTIVMSSSCNRAVAKMTHCPACSGLHEIKPCSNYCSNVMKGCLAYHSLLDPYWNAFIDALDKIVDRLLGPFNIEMVVEPINIKISEAIMNFQENAHQVSQRVFSGCGKPILGRKKREAPPLRPGELAAFEPLQFGGGRKKNRGGASTQVDLHEGKLEKVVKETRSRLRDTKQFWQKLPYHMCGSSAAPSQDSTCWNGVKQDRYTPPVVGDGINNQQNNPEVIVDPSRPNSLVNEQIFALKIYTNKLKNAYNGLDVEWIDMEESFGSGAGSGYGAPEDTDDEDLVRGGGSEGSGSGGPVEETPVEEEEDEAGIPRSELDNELHPIPPGHVPPPPPVNISGNALHPATQTAAAPATTAKSIFVYLVPIVVIWFGNAVNDWFPLPSA